MLLPSIIAYDCIAHDPIQDWIPIDPCDVNVLITFTIGIAVETSNGCYAGDNFNLRILTPNQLTAHHCSSKQAYMVVNYYEWSVVLSRVNDLLSLCKGDTWQEITNQLRQYFDWEYEGMS